MPSGSTGRRAAAHDVEVVVVRGGVGAGLVVALAAVFAVVFAGSAGAEDASGATEVVQQTDPDPSCTPHGNRYKAC